MARLQRLVGWVRDLPPIVVDGGIAAAIVAVETVDILGPNNAQRPTQIVLLVLGAIGVTLRRRSMWFGFGIVQTAAAIGQLLGVPFAGAHGLFLEELVLLYTVADRATLKASAIALLAVMALDLIGWFSQRRSLPTPSGEPASLWVVLLWVFQDFVWLGFVWFAGRAQNRRRGMADSLERNAVSLRREREGIASYAVVSERARIAWDLELVVGQAIRELRRQSRVAQLQFADGDAPTPDAILAMEDAGRGALAQMRRLLTVLRVDPLESTAQPLPSRVDASGAVLPARLGGPR